MTETNPEQPTTDDSPGISALPEPGSSGQFAVFATDLGQYQSGVMSKADAGKALKALKQSKDYPHDPSKLITQEV